MMPNMQWTQQKPTREGYYWVGCHASNGFAADIRYAQVEDDDENVGLSWTPDWDGDRDWELVSDDSPDTVYYGPFTWPVPPPKP